MTELDTRDFKGVVSRDELRLARATGEAVRRLHDLAAQLEAAGFDSRATLRPWLKELFGDTAPEMPRSWWSKVRDWLRR